MFKCPVAPVEAQWTAKFGSGLGAKNGYANDEVRLGIGGSPVPFLSYGLNVYGSFTLCGPQDMQGLGGIEGDRQNGRGEVKPGQVVNPVEMIAIGDSNWNVRRQGSTAWSGVIHMGLPSSWPLDVHNSRANILFVDGHVQAMKRTELASQLAGLNYLNVARLWISVIQPHY